MRKVLLFLAAAISLQSTPLYLVLLKGANAVGYYTPDGRLLNSVPVGQHPHEMAFSPDRSVLYTTDNGIMRIEHQGKGGNTISMVDVKSRRKVGIIPLGEYHRPHGIDVDRSTGRLIVTTENPDALLLIDPVKKSIIRKFETKGKTPHMVTYGPGAKWAYASNAGGDTVAAINLSTAEVKSIQTGSRPEGSVLSKDGKELYVTNREAASITVISTERNQAIANIPTGKGPVRIGLTADGNTLVYALMHEKKIAFANPKTRTQTDYVLLPNTPVSCTISEDGAFAFASAEEADTIYVVSVRQRKLVGEIKTAKGAGPDPVLMVELK